MSYACEMHISVESTNLMPSEFNCILQLVGFGRTQWPESKHLRFDTSNEYIDPYKPPKRRDYSKAMVMFNDLLLPALPSLSKITFRGYCVCDLFKGVLIDQLIDEQLSGPRPL
ncbi:hypothetical protein IWW39_000187 [Coemansia spiralis]|uniref:Uncharacterized protein n=1 Tax=Coemansia spiralis TaxID=417178 RepID=A0A9W8GS75_9FUNG|nr:hypothetical protein IWW39_000187 [Coemansia spiralis]